MSTVADERREFPLSPLQQSLWVFNELAKGRANYVEQFGQRLTGELDTAVLQQALRGVVDRHAPLRTTFHQTGEGVVQRVAPGLELALRSVDLADSADAATALQAEATRQAREPFDLAAGPLLRLCLVRLAPLEHVLLVALPHIVFDAASVPIFTRDLAQLYEQALSGKPAHLPGLPLAYGDYALRERGAAEAPARIASERYWRDKLAAGVPELELPPGRAARTCASSDGASFLVPLPSQVVESLHELARSTRTTPFMVFLALFKVLLLRLTDEHDIVVGTAHSHRSRATRDLVGCFVNLLALRTNLWGNPTVREAVGRIRSTCVDAYQHADVPFSRVVELVNPRRARGENPLFRVTFNQLETMEVEFTAGPVSFASFVPPDSASELDLMLNVMQTREGATLKWQYSTDMLDEWTVRQMAESFSAMIEGAVVDASAAVLDLPLLSTKQRDVALKLPAEGAIPRLAAGLRELLEEPLRRAPASVALDTPDGAVTYRELHASADRLASRLADRGVGPETLVAVCLDGSARFVVAALAVIKAGGAYVALDPVSADHARPVLADSRPLLVVTDSEHEAVLGDDATTRVLMDREEGDQLTHTRRPGDAAAGGNLACVIYTSALDSPQTGVAVDHETAVGGVAAQQAACGLSDGDRLLVVAPPNSDAHATQMHCALSVGATLVLRPRALLTSPARLIASVANARVTVLDLPAASWTQLGEAIACGRLEVPGRLRAVLIRGAHFEARYVEEWLAIAPHAHLFTAIGRTGAAFPTLWARLSTAAGADGSITRVRAPAPHVRAYVLDPRGQPIPPGTAGELFVGGAALARCYLHRAGMTAAAFVPDTWSGERGARMYRTGHRVRYVTDSQIEFLVARGGRLAQDRAVRDDAQRRLDSEFVPPRTPLERLLADIWQEVLRVDAVGVYDDFFEIGGHSLCAIQIVSRGSAAGLTLRVDDLFSASSVAALAVCLQERMSATR